MTTVPNRALPVKSSPALMPDLVESLHALRVAIYGNEALAVSVAERLAPLPASPDLERAQALQKLAEEHAARLRESLDALLARTGLLTP